MESSEDGIVRARYDAPTDVKSLKEFQQEETQREEKTASWTAIILKLEDRPPLAVKSPPTGKIPQLAEPGLIFLAP